MSFFITTQPPTSPPTCIVGENSFRHLFLVPAGIILTVLAFLRRRRSFKKDICGGRPGLVIPVDFLGFDHDRLAIMFVFGATAGTILDLLLQSNINTAVSNSWATAFLTIGLALEPAFLYYPYFACLASYHKIIGAMMGLPYAVVFFSVSTIVDLKKCDNNISTWEGYVSLFVPKIPTMVCQLCILGKFILVLCVEIKKYRIIGLREENSPSQVKFVKPWVKNYVKNLFQQRPPRQYSRMEFYLRKIYNPEKNFKFSTQTLSVVMICYISLYKISFTIVFWSSDMLAQKKKARNAGLQPISWKEWHLFVVALGSLITATVLVTAVCIISLLRFMENHKNNMLRMFKGDKSFIPKKINVSQFMIGKGLRYSSYHIAYFLWGYILNLLFLFVLCFCLSLLSYSKIRHMLLSYLSGTGVIIGVAIITRLSLPITSMTIFRDHDYPKHVISINNRNVYLVFSYFWFFLGLPLALMSAIYRVLKLMCLGAVMLPIINYSVMPDGFQQFDQGFISYICYLHVQTAYRNPILRLFCQILHDHATRRKTEQKWIFSAQARARWFLALTLARNPQLASERRPDIRDPRPRLTEYGGRHSDVLIEVHQYGSDNVALIQDN